MINFRLHGIPGSLRLPLSHCEKAVLFTAYSVHMGANGAWKLLNNAAAVFPMLNKLPFSARVIKLDFPDVAIHILYPMVTYSIVSFAARP